MIFSNSKNKNNYDLTILSILILKKSNNLMKSGSLEPLLMTISHPILTELLLQKRFQEMLVSSSVLGTCSQPIPCRHSIRSSFIQSHIIFCSFIRGSGSKSSLQNIFIAQKKAMRAITYPRLIDYLLKIKTSYYTPTGTHKTFVQQPWIAHCS